MMLVNIANDGPVTLELDSRKFDYVPVCSKTNPAVAKAIKTAALAEAAALKKAKAQASKSTISEVSETSTLSGSPSLDTPETLTQDLEQTIDAIKDAKLTSEESK